MLTGYFSRPEQVTTACRALSVIRAANPNVLTIVDPVMGDAGKGLYVNAAVAEAVSEGLVPRADLITPNAWELSRLSNLPVFDSSQRRHRRSGDGPTGSRHLHRGRTARSAWSTQTGQRGPPGGPRHASARRPTARATSSPP